MSRRFDLDQIVEPVATACAVALVVAIVIPLQGYLANAESFPFSPCEFSLEHGTVFICLWLLLSLFLVKIRSNLLEMVLLALSVALLLEAGPLSIGLPELNGDLAGYKSVKRMVLDSVALIAIMALPLLLFRWLREFRVWIALVLALFACSTLFDVKVRPGKRVLPDFLVFETCPRLEVVRSVRFSKEYNVFVLIVDSVSCDAAHDAVASDPGLSVHFPGFVNYQNNVGMQWMTSLAIPALFTGRYFESPSMFGEYMMSPFRHGSFIEEYLKANDPVYVNCGPYEFGYTNRKCAPLAEDERRRWFSHSVRMNGVYRFTVNELAFFRCLPYAAKHRYLQYITKRDIVRTTDSDGNLEDDGWLWRALSNGPADLPDSVALHVHHSTGGHFPICRRADGSFAKLEASAYEDYVGQTIYSLRRLGAFLDALRKKGIYDRSTILVLGDHSNTYVRKDFAQPAGIKNGFPFLMVKACGATDGFQESQIPTSHSKIASLVRALQHGPIDRAGIEKILTTPLRVLREDCGSEARNWEITADGTVSSSVVAYREKTIDEVKPLQLGKVYSFDPSASVGDYADFTVQNGRRSSWLGLSADRDPLTIQVKIPDAAKRYDVKFVFMVRKRKPHNKPRIEISCGDVRAVQPAGRYVVSRDNEATLKQVHSDKGGVLVIKFKRLGPGCGLTVRSICIKSSMPCTAENDDYERF